MEGKIGSANPSPTSPSAAASPSPAPPSPQVSESVSHPMLTHAKAGTCKPNPKYAHLTAITNHLVEPTCFSQVQSLNTGARPWPKNLMLYRKLAPGLWFLPSLL